MEVKRGYKQTEVGVIPEEWEASPLAVHLRQHNSGIYKRSAQYGNGCNIVGVSDIYDIGCVDGQRFSEVPLTEKERAKCCLEENDLLYGESSLVREGIARTVYVTHRGAGTAFAWHTRRYSVKQDIRAIGCADDREVEQAASCLYANGVWQNGIVSVRLFAVGEEKTQLLIPQNQQITWSEIIQFMICRFTAYRRQKAAVGQWTADGRKIQRLARRNGEESIRRFFNISPKDAPVPELNSSEDYAQTETDAVPARKKQRQKKDPLFKQVKIQELFTEGVG